MNKIALILIIALYGCGGNVAPLKITRISISVKPSQKGKCFYEINDEYNFYDECGKYNIGDTIK